MNILEGAHMMSETFTPPLPLKRPIPVKETRSLDKIYEHYVIEKELAKRLRTATLKERATLYSQLYDELFRKVPHHTQLTRKQQFDAASPIIQQRLALLQPYLTKTTHYLEVGPGDCNFALEVAKRVERAYAVDVSLEITQREDLPDNFQVVLSDGTSIPVPPNSIDVAYSHQLMEHLHPDDAMAQLKNIYRALKPGGYYICITPHRLSGPHDISKYFDEVATGFHLKEYMASELTDLFHEAGFKSVSLCKQSQNRTIAMSLNPLTRSVLGAGEHFVEKLPLKWRLRVADLPLLFRSITLVGQK
jgi:SAM-dependent methyltransferase